MERVVFDPRALTLDCLMALDKARKRHTMMLHEIRDELLTHFVEQVLKFQMKTGVLCQIFQITFVHPFE